MSQTRASKAFANIGVGSELHHTHGCLEPVCVCVRDAVQLVHAARLWDQCKARTCSAQRQRQRPVPPPNKYGADGALPPPSPSLQRPLVCPASRCTFFKYGGCSFTALTLARPADHAPAVCQASAEGALTLAAERVFKRKYSLEHMSDDWCALTRALLPPAAARAVRRGRGAVPCGEERYSSSRPAARARVAVRYMTTDDDPH